jgi:MFS family permease
VSKRISGAVGRTPLLKGLPREVAVLSAVAFCVALGFGILLPALPVFARTFDVSALQASAVISVFALARFVTAPVAGTLVDRLGERMILGTGLFIVAGSSLAAGFSQSYLQLIVLRGVGGLGSSMFTVSALALLLRVVDNTQRGRASSAYQGGFLLGGVAGPAVGGLVVAWSIRAPFFVYAVTLIVAGIVALVFLSNSRLHAREELVSSGESSKLETLRLALKDGAYRAALVVNLITGFLILGLRSSVVPLFVTEGMQKGASLTGIGFLVAAGFQAVLLLPAGRLSDTAGRRKAMLYGTIGTTIGMVALTATDIAVNGWGTTAVAGTALFLIAMAIQGVASAFLGSAPTAVVGDIMGGKRGGIVVATFQMMNDLGIIFGPLVAGLLVDLFDFDWAFAAAAGLSVIAIIFVWLMPETLNRRGSLPVRPPENPAAKELS